MSNILGHLGMQTFIAVHYRNVMDEPFFKPVDCSNKVLSEPSGRLLSTGLEEDWQVWVISGHLHRQVPL